MNLKGKVVFAAAVLAALVLLGLQNGQACPNCYGDPQSPLTDGMNMAIVSLLGVTGGVLAGVAAFFLFLRRRLRLLNQRFADKLN
jgi:hypothetical protein